MQVTYTQGAPPNMFMKDADGNTIEEIGIANWKVEHIEEFRAPRPAPPRTKNTHPSAPPRQFGAALPATPATTTPATTSFCPVAVAEKLAPAAIA